MSLGRSKNLILMCFAAIAILCGASISLRATEIEQKEPVPRNSSSDNFVYVGYVNIQAYDMSRAKAQVRSTLATFHFSLNGEKLIDKMFGKTRTMSIWGSTQGQLSEAVNALNKLESVKVESYSALPFSRVQEDTFSSSLRIDDIFSKEFNLSALVVNSNFKSVLLLDIYDRVHISPTSSREVMKTISDAASVSLNIFSLFFSLLVWAIAIGGPVVVVGLFLILLLRYGKLAVWTAFRMAKQAREDKTHLTNKQ